MSGPLYSAISCVDECRTLILYGADVNKADFYKRTPLHIAARWGRSVLCELLIKAGASLRALDERWQTPLHIATLWGKDDICELLLQADPLTVAQVTRAGETPLFIAARRGNARLCTLFAEAGADLEFTTRYNDKTPLRIAVERGHRDACAALIAAGASPIRTNEKGVTYLHMAASRNKYRICKLLLEFIDVNSVDFFGNTPLHCAAKNNSLESFKVLLADPSAEIAVKNNFGETPLCTAFAGVLHVRYRPTLRRWTIGRERCTEMCRILISAIKLRASQSGVSGLIWQVVHDYRTCGLFIDEQIDARDSIYGWTALHFAAYMGKTSVCKMLISCGADPTLCGRSACEPLYRIAANAYKTAYLPDLAHPADETALLLAAAQGHYETVDALMRPRKRIKRSKGI